MIVVRDAGAEDTLAIAEFQTTCWREAYSGLVPKEHLTQVGVPEREKLWGERLITGSRRIVLAETEQDGVVAVVSWGAADPTDGPPLELKSLYVAASHRGTGLASRLLIHAVGATAPARLWVFTENQRAQAFYRKHGFEPDGVLTVDSDTGVDELRMSRLS